MASIEQDTIKGMLQALEHMLDTVDRTSGVAGHLLNTQKAGTALAPSVIAHYEQQLEALGRQRGEMRDVIARWWTLVEDRH
jgi:hypothetical protein